MKEDILNKLLLILQSFTDAQRDEWKRETLAQFPNLENFCNTAIHAATAK